MLRVWTLFSDPAPQVQRAAELLVQLVPEAQAYLQYAWKAVFAGSVLNAKNSEPADADFVLLSKFQQLGDLILQTQELSMQVCFVLVGATSAPKILDYKKHKETDFWLYECPETQLDLILADMAPKPQKLREKTTAARSGLPDQAQFAFLRRHSDRVRANRPLSEVPNHNLYTAWPATKQPVFGIIGVWDDLSTFVRVMGEISEDGTGSFETPADLWKSPELEAELQGAALVWVCWANIFSRGSLNFFLRDPVDCFIKKLSLIMPCSILWRANSAVFDAKLLDLLSDPRTMLLREQCCLKTSSTAWALTWFLVVNEPNSGFELDAREQKFQKRTTLPL